MYLKVLALVVVLVGVLVWCTWSRLLAVFVSMLAARQGLRLKMESLTMKSATQVFVTCLKGPVDEAQFRRIQLGWVPSGGGEEVEDEDGQNAMQKFLSLLGSFRLYVRFVGVRIRLRKDVRMEEHEEARNHDFVGRARPSKANFLIKNIFPLVSIDLNDVEVLTSSNVTVLKAQRIGVDAKRPGEEMVLENMVVFPGAKVIVDEQIQNEWGMIEVNRMNLECAEPLYSFLNMSRKSRGKKLSVSVDTIRVNSDKRYLEDLEALLHSFKRTRHSNHMYPDAEELKGSRSLFERVLGKNLPAMSIDVDIRSMMVKSPIAGCRNEVEVKRISFDCHTTPWRGDDRGRIEATLVWENILLSTAAKAAMPVLECQSSRSDCSCHVLVTQYNKHDNREEAVEINARLDLQALHTKFNHCQLEQWVSCVKTSSSEEKGVDTDLDMRSVPKATNVLKIVTLSLGNGSSLQFFDGTACILHQSIDSASCVAEHDKEKGLAIKYSVAGIAMADSEGSDKNDLNQVLSTQAFKGSVSRQGEGLSITMCVASLAGVLSEQLMQNLCKVKRSVSSSLENFRSKSKAKAMSEKSLLLGVSVDLTSIDVAIVSRYEVSKRFSSVKRDTSVDSAIALRAESFVLSKNVGGNCQGNGNALKLIHYEGPGVENFSLDFDSMAGSIRSTPLALDALEMLDSDDCSRRTITLAPLKFYGDAEALISMVHFSKSLKNLSISDRPDQKWISKRNSHGKTPKTIILAKSAQFCLPLTSDREISFWLGGCELEIGMNLGKYQVSVALMDAAVSMKGVDTIVLKDAQFSRDFHEDGDALVETWNSEVDLVKFIVPYNRDPGPTFKLAAIYVKACRSIVSSIQGDIQKEGQEQAGPVSREKDDGIPRVQRYRININDGIFMFENHPFEQWHASSATRRRNANLLQQMWDEAYTAFMSETLATNAGSSPLHSGVNENSIAGGQHVGLKDEPEDEPALKAGKTSKPWKAVMTMHSNSFVKSSKTYPEGSLYPQIFEVALGGMTVGLESNSKMLPHDKVAEEALNFVQGLDADSRDIVFRSSHMFNLELQARDAAVKIGGSNRPLYKSTDLQINGPVAFCKQATGAPQVCDRAVLVGVHHVTSISTPLKGTCAPFKVYTDILLQSRSSSVYFTPGFEPSMGLMGITSKRLVPSDPENSSKRAPAVPWWDDLRYFWRGIASVRSNDFNLVLVPGISAAFCTSQERLEVDMEDLHAEIASGKLDVEASRLRSVLFRKTAEQDGGVLCAFPMVDVHHMRTELGVQWNLPGGRSPNNHHIFASALDSEQCPVFVADVFKAASLDVSIDVSFSQNGSERDHPCLFIGGEIISFWRKFIKEWAVPEHIKNQVRRGTYFVRKPRGAKKKGLPKLLSNLSLSVNSKDLQLVHFTLEKDDPGGGLSARTTCGSLNMKWSCNEEVPNFMSLPPHVSHKRAPETKHRTKLRHLEVLLKDVSVKSISSINSHDFTPQYSASRSSPSSSDLLKALISNNEKRSPSSDSDMMSSDSHWYAEHVSISRSGEDSISAEHDPFGTQPRKPLKVKINNCQFMTDLEMRDAIWATVEHLIAAFSRHQQPHHRSIYSCRGFSAKSPEAGNIDQQNINRILSNTSERSAETENNELLSLLLQQKDAAGDSSPIASPQSTVDLDRQESATLEAENLPMTTALDDANSEMQYEVEVHNLQLALQRDRDAGIDLGRLLLASKSAILRGMISEHSSSITYNITTLDMEDVQAYISLPSVDSHAVSSWLDIDDAQELIAPAVEDNHSTWRRIFNPININLRHSKSQGAKSMTSRRTHTPLPSISGLQTHRQGEELILKIPEIAAILDGREFEVLIDVVSFLITSGPTIRTCNHQKNLAKETEYDTDAIFTHRMLFEASCRQLQSIRNEIDDLISVLDPTGNADVWRKQEPLPISGALDVSMQHNYLKELDRSEPKPSDVLRKLITETYSASHPDIGTQSSAMYQDELHANTTLLLKWNLEQAFLALEAYYSARKSLCEVKESLKRQVQFKNSSRVLIILNRVVWQLCGQDRLPFVQASIKKVVFDRRRNRDRSGSARFMIHRLDILDATGVLPEGPATSAGVILTTWNPESSYEREPFIRLISTLGPPTSSYNIYEHLDATVHPLSLHLTEQIATACWEYFFPKEDQKSRQDAFSNSVGSKKLQRRNTEMGPVDSPRKSSSMRMSPMARPDGSEPALSPLTKQDSDVSARSESATMTPPSVSKKKSSPVSRKKTMGRRLLTRFKYVKLNRAHMRITYQGYPIGIKDRVLVINSYTCENLDGTWRDLLSNVKQRAILSAVFSGLGLQGRKVKELMIGAAPSLSSIEIPESRADDVGNNRGLLAKIGLKQQKHKRGDDVTHGDNSEHLELQKKRALFGEGILNKARGLLHSQPASSHDGGSSHGSALPSPRDSDQPVERKLAVPVLELTRPLPPEEDSSDSEASYLDESTEMTQKAYMGPGPLRAGLGNQQEPISHTQDHYPTKTFTYDPRKPPELGVVSQQKSTQQSSTEASSSGPRWMKATDSTIHQK